jgi:hypothetical protein
VRRVSCDSSPRIARQDARKDQLAPIAAQTLANKAHFVPAGTDAPMLSIRESYCHTAKGVFDEGSAAGIAAAAQEENRRIKDVVADLLRRGLDQEPLKRPVICIENGLPVIKVGRPAKPGDELTPDRIKEILLQEEVDHYLDTLR